MQPVKVLDALRLLVSIGKCSKLRAGVSESLANATRIGAFATDCATNIFKHPCKNLGIS